jgi:hypothetical protein
VWNDLHPAWKVCIGLALVIFVAIATGSKVLLVQQSAINDNAELLEQIQQQQKRGEERSYIARAISGCADIINDGEIEITEECVDERVAAYYPPSICERLPIEVIGCGNKATVVAGVGEP